MEYIEIVAFSIASAGWLTAIIGRRKDNKNWQDAQDELLQKSSEDAAELKQAHEDELAEMEASCQELEKYDQSRYDQLNQAFEDFHIKYEIERSRNRKLRPGFNVQAVAKAINKAKGVHVS